MLVRVLKLNMMCVELQDVGLSKCRDLPERDIMDSNDSDGPSTRAFHRRGSLYIRSESQEGLFPPTKELKFVARECSDDGSLPRSSIEGFKEAQALKHRSQSVGGLAASLAGAGKKSKLQALGLTYRAVYKSSN